MAFWVLGLLYIGERKHKRRKNKQRQIAEMPRKIVFVGVGWKKWILAKTAKIAKHFLWLEGEQRAFRQHYLCWETVLFQVFSKNRKHYKNRGFSRHTGKPKILVCFEKGCFWKGSLKGCLLSVIHKSCALLKHYFRTVFSKHSLCRKKGVSCRRQKFTINSGLCFNMPFLFGVFLNVWFGVVDCVLCVCVCVCQASLELKSASGGTLSLSPRD